MGKLSTRDLPGEAQVLLRRRAAASHQSLRAYLHTRANDALTGREANGVENVIASTAGVAAERASLAEVVSVLGGDQPWMIGRGSTRLRPTASDAR